MKTAAQFISIALLFTIASLTAISAQAQPLTTFRIANGKSGENPAALWVGVDQGFFRKHGYNLEVVYMRTGPLAVSALASGDLQTVLTSSKAVKISRRIFSLSSPDLASLRLGGSHADFFCALCGLCS